MFTLDQSHVDDTWTLIQCMQYVIKCKMREKDHPVSLGLVLGQTTDRLYQVVSKNSLKIHVLSTNAGFRCRSTSIRRRIYFVLCGQAVLRLVYLCFWL